jgi:hypothetical protein
VHAGTFILFTTQDGAHDSLTWGTLGFAVWLVPQRDRNKKLAVFVGGTVFIFFFFSWGELRGCGVGSVEMEGRCVFVTCRLRLCHLVVLCQPASGPLKFGRNNNRLQPCRSCGQEWPKGRGSIWNSAIWGHKGLKVTMNEGIDKARRVLRLWMKEAVTRYGVSLQILWRSCPVSRKLRWDWIPVMLATIRFRTFCLLVCCQKI